MLASRSASTCWIYGEVQVKKQEYSLWPSARPRPAGGNPKKCFCRRPRRLDSVSILWVKSSGSFWQFYDQSSNYQYRNWKWRIRYHFSWKNIFLLKTVFPVGRSCLNCMLASVPRVNSIQEKMHRNSYWPYLCFPRKSYERPPLWRVFRPICRPSIGWIRCPLEMYTWQIQLRKYWTSIIRNFHFYHSSGYLQHCRFSEKGGKRQETCLYFQ